MHKLMEKIWKLRVSVGLIFLSWTNLLGIPTKRRMPLHNWRPCYVLRNRSPTELFESLITNHWPAIGRPVKVVKYSSQYQINEKTKMHFRTQKWCHRMISCVALTKHCSNQIIKRAMQLQCTRAIPSVFYILKKTKWQYESRQQQKLTRSPAPLTVDSCEERPEVTLSNDSRQESTVE